MGGVGLILHGDLEHLEGGVRCVVVKDQDMRLAVLEVVSDEVGVGGADESPQDWRPCMKNKSVNLYRDPSGSGICTHAGLDLLPLTIINGVMHTPAALTVATTVTVSPLFERLTHIISLLALQGDDLFRLETLRIHTFNHEQVGGRQQQKTCSIHLHRETIPAVALLNSDRSSKQP